MKHDEDAKSAPLSQSVEQAFHRLHVVTLRGGDDHDAYVTDYEAAKAALIAAVIAHGREWQPIETAPKDGTQILAFDIGGCFIAEYRASVRLWVDGQSRCWAPTNWMPLPDPPFHVREQPQEP